LIHFYKRTMMKKLEKQRWSARLNRSKVESKSCHNIHELARTGSKPALESYLSSFNLKEQQHQIEAKNLLGSTPLQVAAYYGNVSTLTTLQNVGASRDTSNVLGWSARHYASRWSQPLDVQMNVGLKPRNAASNSKMFAFGKIRSLRDRRQEEDGHDVSNDKSAKHILSSSEGWSTYNQNECNIIAPHKISKLNCDSGISIANSSSESII